MPKVMVEVEIPEGWELAVQMMRTPKLGESYIDNSGSVATASAEFAVHRYAIVKKSWKWPEWLTAKWIAMDESGLWHAFPEEPIHNSLCIPAGPLLR